MNSKEKLFEFLFPLGLGILGTVVLLAIFGRVEAYGFFCASMGYTFGNLVGLRRYERFYSPGRQNPFRPSSSSSAAAGRR